MAFLFLNVNNHVAVGKVLQVVGVTVLSPVREKQI